MSATAGLSLTDWHAIRAKHIGSSEVAALFGCQPDYAMSHFHLWQVKAGIIDPPVVDNDRVSWGTRLEPVIAAGLAEERGWAISKGRYHEDASCPGLGSSLDFEIEAPVEGDDGCEGEGILEVKNVDWMIHRRAWTGGEPPIHIILQLQAQLACSGYSWGVVGALVGGNQPQLYRYQRDEKIIRAIRQRVTVFWASVAEGRPPEVDGSDSTADALRALYPALDEESADFRTNNEFPVLCAELLAAADERKKATEKEQQKKNRLTELLAGAKRGWDDSFSVSVAVTAAKPDRAAKEGETIKGRAESRRLTVKERVAA